MKKITIVIAVFLIFIISCDNNSSNVQAPPIEELEAIVKGNSLTLLEAVESFALDNDGYYPANADSDTTIVGMTLIDYLPNGERLTNPFTGLKDQPISSEPSMSGEIGYFRPIPNYNLYTILGYGEHRIIVEHNNVREIEELIVKDCLELQRAIEEWRIDDTYDLRYPCSSADCNQIGDILQDYFPNGCLFKNRLTLIPAEPSRIGSNAILPGEIGYKCILADGIPIGYSITAMGVSSEEFILCIEIN